MIRATVLALALAATLALADDGRLAVIQKAPDARLTDQNGKEVQVAALPEKVLLVGFVFTTCNGTCPATTHRMAKIHDELKKRNLLEKDQVRLVSISLDPKRDTPAVLKGYMQLYEIEPGHWSFLTGTASGMDKYLAAWGMWARPAANGQLDHPSRLFLVDQKRNVREIYNLSFMRTDWVADDIESLLREK